MNVDDFNFELPKTLIASHPLAKRDASRLLIVEKSLVDEMMINLVAQVQSGDVWVINDTKVIPARLQGNKATGGKVELLLLEALPEVNDKPNVWLAWGKSNKPLKVNDVIEMGDGFHALILSRDGKEVRVQLQADDVAQAIDTYGHMPLPPYIQRPDSEEDKQRYQTVFAKYEGAVAAPTAGLHLTKDLMQKMEDAGAEFVHVTLHVGPGTFQPVQVENIHDHVMHEEAYIVSEEAADKINQAKQDGRRVVAVGTTSLRTLEASGQSGEIKAGVGRTDIFIYPGYQFKMVDALLTNFHLPKSTLLMLVSALAGREKMMQAYEHAKAEEYRFYSYGDAMFITSEV